MRIVLREDVENLGKKGDLVDKVLALVEAERREREREAEIKRREEEEILRRQREEQGRRTGSNGGSGGDETKNENGPGPSLTPRAQEMASTLERTGLCVICQDEEANIAIVDCG